VDIPAVSEAARYSLSERMSEPLPLWRVHRPPKQRSAGGEKTKRDSSRPGERKREEWREREGDMEREREREREERERENEMERKNGCMCV